MTLTFDLALAQLSDAFFMIMFGLCHLYRPRSREIMYLVASVLRSVCLFVSTLTAEPFDLVRSGRY